MEKKRIPEERGAVNQLWFGGNYFNYFFQKQDFFCICKMFYVVVYIFSKKEKNSRVEENREELK